MLLGLFARYTGCKGGSMERAIPLRWLGCFGITLLIAACGELAAPIEPPLPTIPPISTARLPTAPDPTGNVPPKRSKPDGGKTEHDADTTKEESSGVLNDAGLDADSSDASLAADVPCTPILHYA